MIKLSTLKENPDNPRFITPGRLHELAKSIQSLPEMMVFRPIVHRKGVIIGGNQRYKALLELGYEEIPEEWVKDADKLSEEQVQEFLIKDNVGYGEWDESKLEGWGQHQLKDWGLSLPSWDVKKAKAEKEEEARRALKDRFIVPPFTVLNTRGGDWADRKRHWRAVIKDEGESREKTLSESELMSSINTGVSLLDPVIAELAHLWFGLEGGNTFDPFAGDSVFGYVSSFLGNKFTGIELREEQAKLNSERIQEFPNSKYVCDDGQNIKKHVKKNSQDLLFSCPPYFDLEVYSDLPNDASNQESYNDFIGIIRNAFLASISCLKDNRFAVIVVGDVRDKGGNYLGFPDDIKTIFKEGGMPLYNELILVESVGALPQRVGRYMTHRKIGKCHQNILVFYKGNNKEIPNNFPALIDDYVG